MEYGRLQSWDDSIHVDGDYRLPDFEGMNIDGSRAEEEESSSLLDDGRRGSVTSALGSDMMEAYPIDPAHPLPLPLPLPHYASPHPFLPAPDATVFSQLRLELLGVPAKTRVETQMKISLRLTQNGVPCTFWPLLLIDESLVIHPSLRRKLNITRRKAQKALEQRVGQVPMLTLAGGVISETTGRGVDRCFGCIARERNLLSKKGVSPSPGASIEEERQRVLQFYSEPLVDFGAGEAILYARVTCYCRHHKEGRGFRLHLTLINGEGQTVAEASAGPLMVTDDHKQRDDAPPPPSPSPLKRARAEDSASGAPSTPGEGEEGEGEHQEPHDSPRQDIQPAAKRPRGDAPSLPLPYGRVLRVVPNQGPVSGGGEVTLLGENFSPSHKVYFGTSESARTECWNSGTILAIAPPAAVPGPVPVNVIDKRAPPPPVVPLPSYTYTQADRQLLETALQVVGLRMTGRMDPPWAIAQAIMQHHPPASGMAQAYGGSAGPHDAAAPLDELAVIAALRYAEAVPSPYPFSPSLASGAGQTLLHLAVSCDLPALVACLLDFPALNINAQDINGMTALHLAALRPSPSPSLVRLLLAKGAERDVVSELGDRPADLAPPGPLRALLIPPPRPRVPTPPSRPLRAPSLLPRRSSGEGEGEGAGSTEEEADDAGEEEMGEGEVGGVGEGEGEGEESMSEPEETMIDLDSPAPSPAPDLVDSPSLKKASWLVALYSLLWSWATVFWAKYRAFLYTALLAATGSWTLIDYIPTITGAGQAKPVVLFPKGVRPLTSACNPPSPICGSPGGALPPAPVPLEVLEPRKFLLEPQQSILAYVLNFGQFLCFILSLILIVYHFKDSIGKAKYWTMHAAIFAIFLAGSLFIFDLIF